MAESPEPLEVINPVRYRLAGPVAMAAVREKRAVDFEAIDGALARVRSRGAVVVAESAGGLAEPLGDRLSNVELARRLG